MFILYKIVVIMGAWLYFNQSWKYLELAGESRVLPPGKKRVFITAFSHQLFSWITSRKHLLHRLVKVAAKTKNASVIFRKTLYHLKMVFMAFSKSWRNLTHLLFIWHLGNVNVNKFGLSFSWSTYGPLQASCLWPFSYKVVAATTRPPCRL